MFSDQRQLIILNLSHIFLEGSLHRGDSVCSLCQMRQAVVAVCRVLVLPDRCRVRYPLGVHTTLTGTGFFKHGREVRECLILCTICRSLTVVLPSSFHLIGGGGSTECKALGEGARYDLVILRTGAHDGR